MHVINTHPAPPISREVCFIVLVFPCVDIPVLRYEPCLEQSEVDRAARALRLVRLKAMTSCVRGRLRAISQRISGGKGEDMQALCGDQSSTNVECPPDYKWRGVPRAT